MITAHTSKWRGSTAALALCSCCILLPACNAQQEGEAARAPAARPIPELTAGPLLAGNDARAWLSSSGGAGDTNYCAARLSYPLDTEPAWSWEYSDGGFSPHWLAGVTHYDGRIYITAYSPNLACLDASSGEVIFNSFLIPLQKDAVQEVASGLGNSRKMWLSGQFMHPAGKLLLLMGLDGEQLLYDVTSDPPACVWQGDKLQGQTAYLLTQDSTCIGGKDAMLCTDFDGSLRWRQLTQDTPDGNVLSGRGILFTRNGGRNIWANRVQDGVLLWSLMDASDITGMWVDDNLGCLYVTYFDERIDALDLEDGSLLWSYDFSYLLDMDSRAAMLANTNAGLGWDERNGYDSVTLENIVAVVMPDCVVLSSEFGKALCLAHSGALRWQREDLPPVTMALGFENAILLQEYWYPLSLASFQLVARLSALPIGAAPDWESVQAGMERIEKYSAQQAEMRAMSTPDEARRFNAQISMEFRDEENPLRILFTRLELLSPVDGSSLASQEMPRWIRNGLCPARDKLVFESTEYSVAYYMNRSPSATRRVQAYNWLEPGGDS